MINRRVDVSQSGNVWMALIALAVILYVIWQLSNSITAGSFRAPLLLGVVFVAFFVGAKIAGDWRKGVYLFFVWLLFEDLIRKYMGNNMYVYFAKDVLVGVTYLSLIASDEARHDAAHFRPPFRYVLGLFFLLGLVQVFNPASPSIFYGLLGLKIYFYYVPLMFVGYAAFRAERDLHRFLVFSTGIAGIIALIGILQSILGLDFLNPHSGADIEELGHLVRTTPSGVLVARPPSVFVSDGRFTEYLVLAAILAVGTAGYLLLRKKGGRVIVFPALACVVVAAVLSGSRGAFMWVAGSAPLLAAGMLWGAPHAGGAAYRLAKAIRRAFTFVAVALFLTVVFFPNVIGARLTFYRETLSPDSPDTELYSRTWFYPVANFLGAFADPAWPVGHGIGTASLGVQYVSRILEVPYPNVGVESGYGNLVLEFGILGLILWVLWTAALVFASLRVLMKLKGTWAFPVAFSIAFFGFLLLFPFTYEGLVAYQNYVLNAFLWFLVGVLFRLPSLVKQGPQEASSDLR
jgi:hypothetical protein